MSKANGYFPLFVSLNQKKIVIIGGGKIASRRIQTLLEFPCEITVIAIKAGKEIEALYQEKKLTLVNRRFEPDDIKGAYFVIAATDDPQTNDLVYECCKRENCMVNHVGDKNKSDFYFPGIVKDDNLVIGITASGNDHFLAREATGFIGKTWLEKKKTDAELRGEMEDDTKTEAFKKQ